MARLAITPIGLRIRPDGPARDAVAYKVPARQQDIGSHGMPLLIAPPPPRCGILRGGRRGGGEGRALRAQTARLPKQVAEAGPADDEAARRAARREASVRSGNAVPIAAVQGRHARRRDCPEARAKIPGSCVRSNCAVVACAN